MRRLLAGGGALALCAALVPGAAAHADSTGTTSLVSVALDGGLAHGWSQEASVSADGRYVAFRSNAPDLVAGDTNSNDDVFVRDRQAGVTTRVSVDSAGAQAIGGWSLNPSMSADGRYVAFESYATNLVPGDTNNFPDVFVHDLRTGVTSRVSVGPLGVQANRDSFRPVISADGRFVAYESAASNLVGNDTNKTTDIFEYDRLVDYTLRVSVDSNNGQANDWSLRPSISADGRYVAFESYATNIAPTPDTNGTGDVFVHDRYSWQTDRVSVNANGAQGSSVSRFATISADGRYVTFESLAANLVPGDTNDEFDLFMVDHQTHAVTRLNVLPTGEQEQRGSIPTTRPTISGDGRYVAFPSAAERMVPNDRNGSWDVLVRDRDTATMTRASVTSDGTEVNGDSWDPVISADGRHVAFESAASNLMPGADPIVVRRDVFIRDLVG